MQSNTGGPFPLSKENGSVLRVKSLSRTERRIFFAHLKGARQVHFASRLGEPGKTKVTSIHPSGAGGVQPKYEVTLYRDEAARLQQRLRKFTRQLIVSGTAN